MTTETPSASQADLARGIRQVHDLELGIQVVLAAGIARDFPDCADEAVLRLHDNLKVLIRAEVSLQAMLPKRGLPPVESCGIHVPHVPHVPHGQHDQQLISAFGRAFADTSEFDVRQVARMLVDLTGQLGEA